MGETVTIDPGYQIFDQVLEISECERLIAALEDIPRGKAGTRHILKHSAVSELANDARPIEIARQFLGETAIPFRATLFAKTSDANWLVAWHQDTALPLKDRFEAEGWGPWSIKLGVHYAHAPTWALARVIALRVHLDNCHAHNGPLMVIPGSHELGVLSDQKVHARAHRSQPTACLIPQGGILAMRPLLIHSSSKSTTPDPRRVLHIEYTDSLTPAPGIHLAVVN